MSRPTKAELATQLDFATDAVTDAEMERALALDERDQALTERDAAREHLADANDELTRRLDDWERATEQRDQALTERDIARLQLQETLTSEQQLRDAHRLTEHLNAGLRQQLDTTRDALAERVSYADGVRAQLDAEQAYRSRLETDLHNQLAVAVGDVEVAHAKLRRWVQTSHDREAALVDALTALARRPT